MSLNGDAKKKSGDLLYIESEKVTVHNAMQCAPLHAPLLGRRCKKDGKKFFAFFGEVCI